MTQVVSDVEVDSLTHRLWQRRSEADDRPQMTGVDVSWRCCVRECRWSSRWRSTGTEAMVDGNAASGDAMRWRSDGRRGVGQPGDGQDGIARCRARKWRRREMEMEERETETEQGAREGERVRGWERVRG
jgi:hypothetical protein